MAAGRVGARKWYGGGEMEVRRCAWPAGSPGLQWSGPLGVWSVPPPLAKGSKLVRERQRWSGGLFQPPYLNIFFLELQFRKINII